MGSSCFYEMGGGGETEVCLFIENLSMADTAEWNAINNLQYIIIKYCKAKLRFQVAASVSSSSVN